MNNFKEIERLWLEFYKTSYPNNIIDTDREFDFMSIDSSAAGCIDTFVDNHGLLDTACKKILKDCRNKITIALGSLEGEAKSYFEKLLDLINKILTFFLN